MLDASNEAGGPSKINTTVAYNPAMKSRSKKGSKRRYITARDVLADIPPPAIARRLTIKPNVSEAKRLRTKAAASPRRKSVRADASAALGVFSGSLGERARSDHFRRTGKGKQGTAHR